MQGVVHILLPEYQGDIHCCQHPFLHILHDKVSAIELLVYEPSVGHTIVGVVQLKISAYHRDCL